MLLYFEKLDNIPVVFTHLLAIMVHYHFLNQCRHDHEMYQGHNCLL